MDRGLELARLARDPMAEAVALSRSATNATFKNELALGAEQQQRAVVMCRAVGDQWETQTALMMLATKRFLASEFAAAEKIYVEMGELGRELNALLHQGWAVTWAPLCRYLLGREDGPSALQEIEEGFKISVRVSDVATQCAALNHMANTAVREGDVERAATLAEECFAHIWKYQVLVPFLQSGLIDAAEAALFALERGARSVPRGRLLRIARLGSAKARFASTLYSYLAGPGLRVTARLAALRKGAKAAEPIFDRALETLDSSPHRWEHGVCLLDAGYALPERRATLHARAREVFARIGARAELERMDREEARVISRPAASPLRAG